ncbi:ornithine cyclodeaminase family protein [Peptostreptococcus anaerobius]|uniref:ornithine cyclodeaminase family protein n=1 Tax=Peptostreptococcus anaerobius TaxID=1261 RepID=UPI003D6EB1CF
MLLINKEEIKKIFTMKDAIEADKLAFSIFSKGGSISPLRTNIESKGAKGNILYMPGYIDKIGVSGLKIVSVFPDNPKIGLASTPGTILLVDDKTGMVSCVLDGTYVTEIRTGAATGAAVSLLARKGSKKAALIGSGGQAESQFDAIVTACETVEEVRIYSRTRENREKFATKMAEKYKGKVRVMASTSPEEAIDDADIIALATTSKEAIIDGKLLKKGALVSGVGSYMPNMHEIDEETLVRASKIYFDSKDAVLSEAGCIITPLEKGTITEEDFTGDLGDLINGDIVGRENDEEIIVFKSVGISTQDITTGKMIYDKALENKVGYEW